MTIRKGLCPSLWTIGDVNRAAQRRFVDMAGQLFGDLRAIRAGCLPFWHFECVHCGARCLRQGTGVRAQTKKGRPIVCSACKGTGKASAIT